MTVRILYQYFPLSYSHLTLFLLVPVRHCHAWVQIVLDQKLYLKNDFRFNTLNTYYLLFTILYRIILKL